MHLLQSAFNKSNYCLAHANSTGYFVLELLQVYSDYWLLMFGDSNHMYPVICFTPSQCHPTCQTRSLSAEGNHSRLQGTHKEPHCQKKSTDALGMFSRKANLKLLFFCFSASLLNDGYESALSDNFKSVEPG